MIIPRGKIAWLQGCYKLSLAERRLDRCLDDLESQLELEASALTMCVFSMMLNGCHMLRRKQADAVFSPSSELVKRRCSSPVLQGPWRQEQPTVRQCKA